MVLFLNSDYYKKSEDLSNTKTIYRFPNGYEVVFTGVVAGRVYVDIYVYYKTKRYKVENHTLHSGDEDWIVSSAKEVKNIWTEVALWEKPK